MQSQEEEDFLMEDAEKILAGKPYHWRDWSIVLDKDVLFLWSDAVVLALPKFSYGWFYFTLDGKLAAINPDGIPVKPIHIHLREILEKLQRLHKNQMKTGTPSQPILSAPGAIRLVVGEWSLFCNKEGEMNAQNSITDTVEIMLKEDLPGFIFQTNEREKKSFIAENILGPEFAAGWAVKREKRFIAKSKLEDLNQKEADCLKEDAEEILAGKPYHWRDWSIVLDKGVLYLWSDAVVLGLTKFSFGWFYFIIDGKLAAMNPDGIPVNPIHIQVSEILEKLQEIHQSQMETGPPSQPILSAPGAIPLVVGEWTLFCNKKSEISAQNSITGKLETIKLKEDLPGFIFETDIVKKKTFIAENSLGPEFAAGWALKKVKRCIAKSKLEDLKQKEEEFLIEDAKEILLGKPYHWRDWSIVLDKGSLYLWNDAAVLQLSDGSGGWFRFILDGKITEMFPGAILKNETDECRREILKHLKVVRRSQVETGSPSQSILSAPGTTRLVFGTWSLFSYRDGEISVRHSIFSKQRIVLKEDLPGFIFEPDIGDKRLFTAERPLGPEVPEGWAKKKGKHFNPKSKLKDLTQKEEDLSENVKEILPGKPYHWNDWSIVLDDIYLYLWNDAAVLDLCKESGGWFRFILDGKIAVMHSRGITVNVPDECRRETLEKLQAIHRNQVKTGRPSQPIFTAPGVTRLVVGNWFLLCNTDGEISVRHSIYCKHAITLKEDMPGFIFESSIGKTFSFTAKISLDPEFAAGWAGKKEKCFNANSKLEDLKPKEEEFLIEDAKEIVLGKPYHWRDWSIVLDKDYFFLWSDAAVLQLSKGNIGWFRFILDGEIALMYSDGTPGNELDEYRREIQERLQEIRQSQMETGPPSQPILSAPGSTSLVVGPWSLLCKKDGEIRVHNSFLSQETIVLKEDLPGFIFETENGGKKSFTAKKSLGPEFVAGWAKKKAKHFSPKLKLKDLKQKIK